MKQKAISLLSLSLLLGAQVMVADLDQSEDDITRGCSPKGCKTFKSAKVCGNLEVGGSATVRNLTAKSIAITSALDVLGSVTVGGDLTVNGLTTTSALDVLGDATVGGDLTVNGLAMAQAFLTQTSGTIFRNYALLANTSFKASSTTSLFQWAATNPNNVSSGITHNTTTGLITLPTSGFFFVQYSSRVRFDTDNAAGIDASLFSVYLSQGSSSSQTAITDKTINSMYCDVASSGVTNLSKVNMVLTGYAFIRTTSSSDNVITLTAGLPVNIAVEQTTVANDANAQMVIFQLN